MVKCEWFVMFFSGCFVIFQLDSFQGIMNAQADELPQKSDDERKFREWLGGNAQSRQKWTCYCDYATTCKWRKNYQHQSGLKEKWEKLHSRQEQVRGKIIAKLKRFSRWANTSLELHILNLLIENVSKLGSNVPGKEECNSFGFLFKLHFAIIHCARVCVGAIASILWSLIRSIFFKTPSLPVAGEVSRIA